MCVHICFQQYSYDLILLIVFATYIALSCISSHNNNNSYMQVKGCAIILKLSLGNVTTGRSVFQSNMAVIYILG